MLGLVRVQPLEGNVHLEALEHLAHKHLLGLLERHPAVLELFRHL